MLSALLTHLETYLNDSCPLQQVEEWVVAHLQEILNSGDQEAIQLANQVDAALVEFSAGALDEVVLRQRLESLVRLENTIAVTWPRALMLSGMELQTGTQDATITEHREVPGQVETLDLGRVLV